MYFNLSFMFSFGFIILHVVLKASGNTTIIYNGFKPSNLTLDGVADIMPSGLLRLTNETKLAKGHAFYSDPIPFKLSPNGPLLSFSTTFVFGITSKHDNSIGHGLVFIITPTRGLPYSFAKEYLGLFNNTSNGDSSNHVVGVEFDTNQDPQFNDINDDHVGIDINNLESVVSKPAGYMISNTFNNISLHNRDPIQVWIEYDAIYKKMDVTLAPINMDKPVIPLLTLPDLDLSSILNDTMYIGFSASTGSSVLNSHYILGWSFALNGTAPPLHISKLPPLPTKKDYTTLTIILSITIALVLIVVCFGVFYVIRRTKKFSEELEDWESEYGPHRLKYKDLYVATKGFKDKEVLGTGGFGKVYKGTLLKSNTEVAVKKVSHDSKQGMQEFVSEIVSIGRLRHRNLVQLLGYCRRKGELLLVYEYMPKGSLDKILHQHGNPNLALNWDQRFNIIKGVASGLLYLHEEWEQVVVHRDIKSSNVLLNSDLNARLGDFGLARLHDHGADPQTTVVKGTLGYLAPEHLTGKATPSIDVFAFGALVLEVVCGRRPIDFLAPKEDTMLVNMVFRLWKRGDILRMVDPKLKGKYLKEEVVLVLKLGLLCSNVDPEERPTMREVVGYLDGVVAVPDLGGLESGSTGLSFVREWKQAYNDLPVSYTSSANMFTYSTSITESQLSDGR